MTQVNAMEVKRKIFYLQDKIIALTDKLKMYTELKMALEDILSEVVSDKTLYLRSKSNHT